MTLEALRERLVKLQAEYEQTKANMHAYEGAIQECQYWLNQLQEATESGADE